MFTAVHEWSPPHAGSQGAGAFPNSNLQPAPREGSVANLYRRLLAARPGDAAREQAAHYLREQIARLQPQDCDLPEEPEDLAAWMQCNAQLVTAKYVAYLEERKAGAPRRFFSNRAHALYFLRAVAPTKLVDGAWLYGLLPRRRQPALAPLIRTYVEELGEGGAGQEPRAALPQAAGPPRPGHGRGLGDALHVRAPSSWRWAGMPSEFLPEVIGFNLGYEQLPLHLLITAYELNELGIDPYYFTLHVTVDNADTGHAMQACEAVLRDAAAAGRCRCVLAQGPQRLPAGRCGRGHDRDHRRLRYRAARCCASSCSKSQAGHGAHSDYCRIGGRGVNDWLSQPDQIPAFLAALEQAGWIKRGAPVQRQPLLGPAAGRARRDVRCVQRL